MPKERYLVTEQGWKIPQWNRGAKIAYLLISTRVGTAAILALMYILENHRFDEIKQSMSELPKRLTGYIDVTADWKYGVISGNVVSERSYAAGVSRCPTTDELINYSASRRDRIS